MEDILEYLGIFVWNIMEEIWIYLVIFGNIREYYKRDLGIFEKRFRYIWILILWRRFENT
jgi:hypothetical protein